MSTRQPRPPGRPADTARPRPRADLRIDRVPIDHRDAELLIEGVQQEYVLRYGGRDDTPMDPAEFTPPGGAFYVGYRDGVPVMTGAWRFRERR